MESRVLTAVLIASLAGILAGGGGVLLATKGDRANKHDAAMEQARASQVEAAARAGAEAVSEAMAPTLVQVTGLAESWMPLAVGIFGIGAIIGTGIFVLTAEAATKAGPAMMVSFVIAVAGAPSQRVATLIGNPPSGPMGR
jgi:hypothetical protein